MNWLRQVSVSSTGTASGLAAQDRVNELQVDQTYMPASGGLVWIPPVRYCHGSGHSEFSVIFVPVGGHGRGSFGGLP